jgi:hypothetical protein
VNDQTGPTVPLACVPDAIPAADRATHFARLRHLFDHRARERRDVAGGFSWRFPAEALDEIAAFVTLERRCCPFLRFRVDVAPDGGPVWLTLDGPPGTPAFLAAELGLTGTGDAGDASA